MIVKEEDLASGSSTHHDDVASCKLRRTGNAVVASLILRNGEERTFESSGPVFVMNDDGVTIDRLVPPRR